MTAQFRTRHAGLVSIAAIEIGKYLGSGVCDDTTIAALGNGEIFAFVITTADWIMARIRRQT